MNDLEAFFKVTEAIKEIRRLHNHRSTFFYCHFFPRQETLDLFHRSAFSLVLSVLILYLRSIELLYLVKKNISVLF